MVKPFPEWIRRPWASDAESQATRTLLSDLGLHTVCQSARCPNRGECWRHQTATFMVLGNVCTRNCAFCSVKHGAPGALDEDEPARVAEAARRLKLAHVVVTMVTRDDLADGGAGHMARTVEALRAVNGDVTTEVLVSDFQGDRDALEEVVAAEPTVFGHNIETVERLYPELRDGRYAFGRSLDVLARVAASTPRPVVKSAFMVGHGETEEEVLATLRALRDAGCDVVCMGQYLQPSTVQREVVEFVPPERLAAYERMAYDLGFAFAVAGPFVRSSYRSAEAVERLLARVEDSEERES